MNFYRIMTTGFICTLLFISTVHAEQNARKDMKLGFGFDRGLGVTGSVGKLNGFIGNDGAAIDYVLRQKTLKLKVDKPVFWYIAVGGYGDWDGDIGIRLPVGMELYFTDRADAYAQVMPQFRVNNSAEFGLDFAIGARYKF